MPHALIVDDDPGTRDAMVERLEQDHFRAHCCDSLATARAELETRAFDLILLDLQLPDGSGLALLDDLEAQPASEVVFITGHASVDSAVEAFRGGAIDYLTKPIDLRRLAKIIDNVLRTLELREEIDTLRGELRRLGRFGRIVGASENMQRVYDMLQRVAPTDSTVLVVGETGTGKDLAAETVHQLSRRAKKPYLPINCGAMTPSLIESELFGHERGSFTGADRMRKGIFERADGGTLFLDEITEMPLELQVKLLRVLETGTVQRIGGETLHKIDVRMIAATNRNPKKAVSEGKLREDLLYRLLVFPIELPPLRERGDDLDLLAQHFLRELNRQSETAKRITDAALERLRLHTWPGNVRELKHVIERAFIMAHDVIDADGLPADGALPTASAESDLGIEIGMSIAEAERRLVLATLDRSDGDKKRAAEVLGISLKTLYNRLNAYKAS
jgi:DNA-binding NtrC family response regulator